MYKQRLSRYTQNTLHLLGFDHMEEPFASVMRSRENEILDKMIASFAIIIKDDCPWYSDEKRKIIDEGLDLFREYYFDLWW